MDDDASRLFEQDRQRFLALFSEFLNNQTVPLAERRQVARDTTEVLRQLSDLAGFHHG